MKQATTTSIVTILCFFLFSCAYSENHTVGGAAGWDLTADISGWALQRTFHTGDNLKFHRFAARGTGVSHSYHFLLLKPARRAAVFSYAPIHDVREVTQTNFELCRASNPLNYFSGGLTVVSLDSPGTRHFICGTLGHCVLGLSLRVHVLPNGTAAAPTPAPTDDNGDGDRGSGNGARTASPSASPLPSGAMHKPKPPRPSNRKAPPPPHSRSAQSPGFPCAEGHFCSPVVFAPPVSTAPSAHSSSGTTMAHLNLLSMSFSIWLWLLVTGLSEDRGSF
ncbi:Mavicyanin [Nymphaea thermarum]|nr:Mavicyanin [Nymphaea thermarum]